MVPCDRKRWVVFFSGVGISALGHYLFLDLLCPHICSSVIHISLCLLLSSFGFRDQKTRVFSPHHLQKKFLILNFLLFTAPETSSNTFSFLASIMSSLLIREGLREREEGSRRKIRKEVYIEKHPFAYFFWCSSEENTFICFHFQFHIF